ncbi:monosaccharide ABC transporter membrane protein, CUT2 family [Psychromonas ingrahamii 37]|jgi:ribose transport system permease protein|uniref:Monosaccharide ABC transporter membrane protein, CUT2 family n=1 Tax=Psychromonas ingrahamii (strain DSM 17664 / CCUG 51855 / 37) TaxID=357804 RepID=A1SYD0_PSYIN|nr:ABC transporter permease [Psychromonas ingrahamii]ABM04495.1 monosaccharide ABC transporter membrane protein, CUT2 family [Psychromonas ingrahamii 37]
MRWNNFNKLKIQPIWFFVLILIVFFSSTSEYFFEFSNFKNIFIQTSTIGLIALGLTFVMINGNIDLSVGSMVALSASITIGLQGYGLGFSIFAALLAGVLFGALNGIIVWKTGVDSFIVTLGAMIGIRGVVFIYTEEQSFYALDFAFSDFGSSSLLGIPSLVLIFLFFSWLMHFILSRTIHGRNMLAIGGSRTASLNAGMKIGRHLMINFMICGFLAALAGITLSSQMGASTPNLGRDFELWAITAVVLGGTHLKGGSGSIIGTLGGVIAIGVLRNGMNLLHIPSFYVLVILGVILISVIYFDSLMKNKMELSQ